MQYRFDYPDQREGATVALYEGEATILADTGGWCVGTISLDALEPVGIEVELSKTDKLYETIALWLYQPEQRRKIDEAWERFRATCREERVELPI